MYLLFQLKSHAYMYESTPQHIIDEEYAPGPVAAWMDSSTSDDDTSSDSDSDASRESNTTAGRMRKLMGRRKRRRSAGSRDTDLPAPTRTPSYATSNVSPIHPDAVAEEGPAAWSSHRFGAIDLTDDADDEAAHAKMSRAQSFNEKHESKPKKERKQKKKKRHHKNKGAEKSEKEKQNEPTEEASAENQADGYNEPRRVDFAVPDITPRTDDSAAQKKQFSLLAINIRPAIPKTLSQNVFTQPPPSGTQELPVVTGPIPHIRYGIRRTNSLPDRLNQTPLTPQTRIPPTSLRPAISNPDGPSEESPEVENISRTTAVLLLLISTGLVALCANFMVDSINSVTQNTSLGATFVGLILLPIVGNAAEHVTSVTVATKNKMDLAIGVAVGSSIQIGKPFCPRGL
jgi:Ca2+:H+ antiporter